MERGGLKIASTFNLHFFKFGLSAKIACRIPIAEDKGY